MKLMATILLFFASTSAFALVTVDKNSSCYAANYLSPTGKTYEVDFLKSMKIDGNYQVVAFETHQLISALAHYNHNEKIIDFTIVTKGGETDVIEVAEYSFNGGCQINNSGPGLMCYGDGDGGRLTMVNDSDLLEIKTDFAVFFDYNVDRDIDEPFKKYWPISDEFHLFQVPCK